MIFETLKINNFLSISSVELNLRNRGLLLIQGKNLDDMSANSNGSGKSCTVDALCWALYGQTARGIKADDVVNNKEKKNTFVSIDILDNEDFYNITRYRKHDKLSNSIVILKNNEDISKGLEKDNQELIDSIVGADYDVFCAAVYSGQELMVNLPEMTDKQLKELIGKAIDIQKIEAAYSLALTEKNFLSKDIVGKSDEIKRLEQNLSLAIGNREDAESNAQTWGECTFKEKKLLEKDIKDLLELIKTQEEKVSAFDEEAKKLELGKLQEERDDLYDKNALVDKINSDLNILRTKRSNLASKYNGYKNELQSYLNKIEKVSKGEESKCSVCGQTLDDGAKKEIIKAYTDKQDEISLNMLKIKDEVKEIDDLIANKVKESIALDFNPVDCKQTYNTISDKMSEINEEIWDFQRVSSDLSKNKNVNFNAMKKQYETLETKENPFRATTKRYDEQVKFILEDIDIHKEELKKLEADMIISNEVINVLSPAGVRAHILDTITPYLNEKTNKYLTILSNSNLIVEWSTLTRNKSGAIKEKFAIEVRNVKGGGCFKALSGGEKRKVRLACGLALQDLISTRATKPISLWIGDEIDDALDSAGLELLTNVLEIKAEEKGTVLIISHNDLKDWCNNSITITKKNGLSTISE